MALAQEQVGAPEIEPAPPPVKPVPPPPDDEERGIAVGLTALSVLLAGGGAVFMASGLFRGGLAIVNGLTGLVIGVGLTALSFRSRRPSFLQYMVMPAAFLAGALFALFGGKAEVGELFHLITAAVKAGGLGQPPVPLDPGWQFILVLAGALLGAAALSLAVGHGKPQIASFFPLPFIFATGLAQPGDGAVLHSAVALGLFVGSLLVGYGVELAREGVTSKGFEVRRLLRGTGMVAVLTALLMLLSRLGFLFPEPRNDQKIPPRRPTVSSLLSDRVLFTVESKESGPWRLGTMDIYKDGHWLLPPIDTGKFDELEESGEIPKPLGRGESSAAKFTVDRLEGHILPSPSNPRSLARKGYDVAYDPRTQTFRLPEKAATKGLSYTVEWAKAPKAEELATAPKAPKSLEPFLEAPIQPNEVVTMLAKAPANPWERLGFVRNELYSHVISAGPGKAGKIQPAKVAAMLGGGEANPFEITAADVLLARWAGIPARIGYGFFEGEHKGPAEDNIWEVHPKNGATWLEAYFHPYGWIPIIGVPQKAKGSLSSGQKQANQNVESSDDLALIVYVPVRLQSILLLYQIVRYWFMVTVPWVLGILLVWAFFPGPLKTYRKRKRRKWAEKRGPDKRILTAYTEFRDAAYDLNVGDFRMTPLEFVSLIEDDPEHADLAWLVSRAIWGDLRRDLRAEDADSAEQQARSVTKRLSKAQLPTTRVLAYASRASLREPYTRDIPNTWPNKQKKLDKKKPDKSEKSDKPRRPKGSRRAARKVPEKVSVGAMLAIVALVATSCGRAAEAPASKPSLPKQIAPETLGDYQMLREPEVERQFKKPGIRALVKPGHVYTIRRGPDVEGYFQIAAFKPRVGANREEVRSGILNGLDLHFEPARLRSVRIYQAKSLGQRYFVYFPDNGNYFELLVAKDSFKDADKIFAGLLAYQRGENPTAETVRTVPEIFDVRRGGDE